MKIWWGIGKNTSLAFVFSVSGPYKHAWCGGMQSPFNIHPIQNWGSRSDTEKVLGTAYPPFHSQGKDNPVTRINIQRKEIFCISQFQVKFTLWNWVSLFLTQPGLHGLWGQRFCLVNNSWQHQPRQNVYCSFLTDVKNTYPLELLQKCWLNPTFCKFLIVAFAVYLKMKQKKVEIPSPGESRNSTVSHRKKHNFILWHA